MPQPLDELHEQEVKSKSLKARVVLFRKSATRLREVNAHFRNGTLGIDRSSLSDRRFTAGRSSIRLSRAGSSHAGGAGQRHFNSGLIQFNCGSLAQKDIQRLLHASWFNLDAQVERSSLSNWHC